jgi:methyl-accepting chemotaxis protein
VASSAKGALIAGGAAAAAGVAGAVVLARSNHNRKVLGIPVRGRGGLSLRGLMPANGSIKSDAQKVAGAVNHAAKRADRIGRRVSQVASSVQQVSETAEEGAKKA